MLLSLLLCLLLSRSQAAEPKDLALTSADGRWALLVGVDTYDDEQIPDLAYAGDDAYAMARVLVESGVYDPSHVVVLTPDQPAARQPTAANIRDQLARLQKLEGAESVLFFFSGHGSAVPGGAEDDRQNVVYPQDTSTQRLAQTGVPVAEIVDALEGADAQRTLVILDACRNELPPDAKALPPAWSLPRYQLATGTQIIYSTRFGDYSYEDDAARLGRLTHHLVEALEGGADGIIGGARDGVVSSMEMYNYALMRMQEQSQDGRVQIPTLAGDAPDLPVAVTRWSPEAGVDLQRCVSDDARLADTLSTAREALGRRDTPSFLSAAALADCQLQHLTEPLRPETALSWHRVEASRALLAGDHKGALSAQRAASELHAAPDPRAGLLLPELLPIAEEAREFAHSATDRVPRVLGTQVYVDGDRSRRWPTDRVSLVQGFNADGSLQWSAIVRPGFLPPALELPSASIRSIPLRRGLLLSAGLTGLASSALWVKAGLELRALEGMAAEIANPTDQGVGFSESEFLQAVARQRAWAAAAAGTAVFTGALGSAGITLIIVY